MIDMTDVDNNDIPDVCKNCKEENEFLCRICPKPRIKQDKHDRIDVFKDGEF